MDLSNTDSPQMPEKYFIPLNSTVIASLLNTVKNFEQSSTLFQCLFNPVFFDPKPKILQYSHEHPAFCRYHHVIDCLHSMQSRVWVTA